MAGKKVRVAFIGAGRMANKVHYPSVASFADVEIAAICDLNAEALTATGALYGVTRLYTDYKQMVNETRPEAVYAIGQPHLMYDIWQWCLSEGLHLYIEKPLGITLHQARALVYLADKHGCITQVGFQRRSTPLAQQLRDKCLARGSITHAVCRFYKSELKPYLQARDHMMDDTVHSIDTLRWMCGGEVVRIESHTKRIGVPDINFIAATLHFDNGSTGYLINSWSSGRRKFSVEMHAPNICAEAEHERAGTLYADGDTTGTTYTTEEAAGSSEYHVYAGFAAKHREFIDAIQAGTQPSSNFKDACKTMEVAEIILAQALLNEVNDI